MTTMPPAQAPADPGQLKTLDALRQRLSTLNNALLQTRAQVESGESLPPWPVVQQSLHLSSAALTDLAGTLSSNHDVLASLHAYSLPSYPSTAPEGVPMAENVRLQLMRKKLEPAAEDLIESGAKFMDQRQCEESQQVDVDEMQELWDWAADHVPTIIMKQAWNADYTNDELERGYKSVRTGLKRKLNRDKPEEDEDEADEESSEEEGEGDAMEVDGQEKGEKSRRPPAMSIEETLRFLHKGAAPGLGLARQEAG